ncbi:uncharacterized protein IUM83_09804 [Phytophthora cinnamomi]|uniref:uncharacterized protein n=1 Tax=Phytophthora cinnamomi TaxID=4785 RepID=UPI003559E6D5|nr:hypothetical protein IUM83_09804 [Phytophthora cinnamomi]
MSRLQIEGGNAKKDGCGKKKRTSKMKQPTIDVAGLVGSDDEVPLKDVLRQNKMHLFECHPSSGGSSRGSPDYLLQEES